jgi:hypothetical protein
LNESPPRRRMIASFLIWKFNFKRKEHLSTGRNFRGVK